MSMRILNIERMREKILLDTCDFFCSIFHRIVGDDDAGDLFTPEEYEQYKKRVLPMVRNHAFSSVNHHQNLN